MKKKIKIKLVKILFILMIAINAVLGIWANIINDNKEENIAIIPNYTNANVSQKQISSLYIWEIDEVNLSQLKDEVEYLQINTLYIEVKDSDEQLKRFKQIMEFAKLYNLDVFILGGSSETRDALTNKESTFVRDLIDKTYHLNQELDYKIKGVSLDIEFYLTDEYQQYTDSEADTEKKKELFKTYTDNNKKYCDYANSLGLAYAMALPVWLDKLDSDTLEELMNYNYDHIAFMNYFKETIMDNLNEEVDIAKKHNLNIVTITELQKPKEGILGEEDSFYYDGLDECINTLKALKEKYNYEKLGVSYHYYLPLLDLIEGIQNKYELEIQTISDGVEVLIDEVNVNEEIKYFIDKDGKIVLLGLEYGKEYTIKVKKGNLVGTKTFIYQKDDSVFDDLGIANINLELEEKPEDDPIDDVVDEESPDDGEIEQAPSVKPEIDNEEENEDIPEADVTPSESDNGVNREDIFNSEEGVNPPYTGVDIDFLKYLVPLGLSVIIAILSEIDDMIVVKDKIMNKK